MVTQYAPSANRIITLCLVERRRRLLAFTLRNPRQNMEGYPYGWKTICGILSLGLLAAYLNNPPPRNFSQDVKEWMRLGYQMTYAGRSIFYRVHKGRQEDGPVLLCIHGFPTSSFDFLKVMPGYQGKFSRVVSLDMLGFGLSSKPEYYDYSIYEQTDIIEKLLETLKINSVHIVAHDYGDTVAQELLARYNERYHTEADGTYLEIQSVCLLNGGIFPETNFPRPGQQILRVPYLGPVLSRISNYFIFRRGLSEVFGYETQPTDQDFDDFWGLVRNNNGDRVLSSLLSYVDERKANRERWVKALQESEAPIHVIWGPADPVNPRPFIKHFKKLVPEADITVLPNHISHYPHWEAPKETNQAYFKFLKSLPYK